MLEIFDRLEEMRPGRSLGIPRAEGEALYTFIKEHNIKRVLETGICYGFTSYYILAALPEDGMLISIEPSTDPQIGDVVPKEWHYKWERFVNTSRNSLHNVFLLRDNIDLFFHDSDHSAENQSFEYETAYPYAKYVGSHDITFSGPDTPWIRFKHAHNLTALIELGELGIVSTASI